MQANVRQCPSILPLLKGFVIAILIISLFHIIYVKSPIKLYLEREYSDSVSVVDLDAFPLTDFSKSYGTAKKDFFLSHQPSFVCPEAQLNRVGKSEDGGKWTCGLETLGQKTIYEGYNCTVYSFGVAGDSSFEAEVLQSTYCNVFAYDPSVNGMGPPLNKSNPRVHFQKLGLAGSNSDTKKTLKTFMMENGHSFIDILKVDVEGWEYNFLPAMFQDFEDLPFGQLLIEFHIGTWKMERKKQTINLFKEMEKRGARMFSVEPNQFHENSCSEYSFINLKKIDLFLQLEN